MFFFYKVELTACSKDSEGFCTQLEHECGGQQNNRYKVYVAWKWYRNGTVMAQGLYNVELVVSMGMVQGWYRICKLYNLHLA